MTVAEQLREGGRREGREEAAERAGQGRAKRYWACSSASASAS